MSEPKRAPNDPPSAELPSPDKTNSSRGAQQDATLDTSTPSVSAAARQSAEPKSIGPYRLIRKLGEGGMGLVWLAEQTAPVRRPVAVKLIRTGLYDDSVLQRFHAEQQSLAMMNHPAIAKVFDAGSTPDGQPYFVMEYVEGSSVTRYCDAKKLKIRDRLELFIKVCEGVQHAHQKAIIHRDLKPSNVLVAEVDGKPVPRIIDFGIAKAFSASRSGTDQTLFTQAGVLVGTPGFMSPEQAAGMQDVDTRTDVYSLGVILYVLLTGTSPFDTEDWKKRPIDEILRQLRQDDPPSPSTKLRKEKDTATAAAEYRSTNSPALTRLLHGDLDCIALKAVDKDRARRYGTPNDLAADIQRYLNNEPVLARPASAAYRLRKYVRRHRIGVAVSAAAVLLLIAFASAQAVELRRITRERDRANRITDFMTNMFKQTDPSEARGNTVTAREVLDKASTQIQTGLVSDPDLQAQLMTVMGNVYFSLGLFPSAQAMAQRAVDIRTQIFGPRDPETLRSTELLGVSLRGGSHYAEAEKLQRASLDVSSRVLGLEHHDTLVLRTDLATTLEAEGHYTDAEKLNRETLEIRRRNLGPDHPDTLTSARNFGRDLQREGRYVEAEKLDTETLSACRRVFGPEDPQTLIVVDDLGLDLRGERKYPQEESLERALLEIRRRILGPEHPLTLGSQMNLAVTLRLQKKLPEAEQLSRDTVDAMHRVLGPQHRDTLASMNNLSIVFQQEGRYADAEKLIRETISTEQQTIGPEHPNTLNSMSTLGLVLRHENKLAEAETLHRQAWEISKRTLGLDHPSSIAFMTNLINCLFAENKIAEVEPLGRQMVEIKRRVLGPDDVSTADAVYDLGVALALQGKNDEALKDLQEAVDHGLRPEGLPDLEKNPAFKSLRHDKRFDAIVADARRRNAAAKQSKK